MGDPGHVDRMHDPTAASGFAGKRRRQIASNSKQRGIPRNLAGGATTAAELHAPGFAIRARR